jgi:hypothetical protein
MGSVYSKLIRIDQYPTYVRNLIVKVRLYRTGLVADARNSRTVKSLRRRGITVGDRSEFLGKPIVTTVENSNITIGSGVKLDPRHSV